jgi:hypothetical protein
MRPSHGSGGRHLDQRSQKPPARSCPIDPDSEVYGEEVRVLLYGKQGGVPRVFVAIRGDLVHVLTVRHSAQRSLAEEIAEWK